MVMIIRIVRGRGICRGRINDRCGIIHMIMIIRIGRGHDEVMKMIVEEEEEGEGEGWM